VQGTLDPAGARREIWRLIHARQWQAAAEHCRQLTASTPLDPAGWYAASHVALGLGDPQQALADSQRALALAPGDARLLLQQARCLLALGRVSAAAGVAAKAQRRSPAEAALLDAIGTALSQAGDHRAAITAYDRAVALAPDNASFTFNRAAVRRYLGELSEAEADYQRVIELNPRDYEAYRNRSDLRRQTPSNNHIGELQSLLGAGSLPWQGAVQLHYALAKEFEDLGEYEASFRHLQHGASLRRRHLRYDVATDLATVEWIIAAFPHGSGERTPLVHAPAEGDAPIFVLGLPRSGSTLVDRILTSHPRIASAGELRSFALCVVEAVRPRTSAADARSPLPRRELVAHSASLDFAALGHSYLEHARAEGAPPGRFTDKMPLNYLYCGLIERALPHSPIVHVTRTPMAACYAMYKTLFQDGYPFSYDLDELARYYIGYRRLMEHWHVSSQGRIHRLSYERLVADQPAQTRALLQYCGLPWEDACMDFHLNTAPSTTASAAQIRQPLYTTSIAQWRHYGEQLSGLAQQLHAAGIDPEAEQPG
jgi:hypothetical protein